MIEAHAILSEKECMKAMKLHRRYNNRRGLIALFSIFVLGGLFTGISAFLGGFWGQLILIPGLICLVLPILLPPILIPMQTWMFRRNLQHLPALGKELVWRLDLEQICCEGEGMEFRMEWTHMYEAIMATEGVLLYPQKCLYYWIPTSAFSDSSTFNAAKRLITQKIQKVKQV